MALSDYGLITGIQPNGGWRFEQPFQDGIQRIPFQGCAGTGDLLVKQVIDFRAGALIELGDVEWDVAEFIKRVSPFNNKYPKRGPKPKRGTISFGDYKTPLKRIAEWLTVMAPRRPRLLIEDDAEARAGICAKCPQNIRWQTGCLPCNDQLISRGHNLRQKPDFPPADCLGACRLHGSYLPAAIFIDNEFLDERHPDAPEFCWVQRILNEA